MNKLLFLSPVICIVGLATIITGEGLAAETETTTALTRCQTQISDFSIPTARSADYLKKCLASVGTKRIAAPKQLTAQTPAETSEKQSITALPAIKTATPTSAKGASGER